MPGRRLAVGSLEATKLSWRIFKGLDASAPVLWLRHAPRSLWQVLDPVVAPARELTVICDVLVTVSATAGIPNQARGVRIGPVSPEEFVDPSSARPSEVTVAGDPVGVQVRELVVV